MEPTAEQDAPTVAQAMKHFEKQKYWLLVYSLRYAESRTPEAKLELQERARDYSMALDLLDTYDTGGAVRGWIHAVSDLLKKAGR